MPHVHVRDAIRVIMDDMERFYEKSPYASLLIAFEKARTMSPNQLKKLREREFGTLPNTESKAIEFLRRSFADYAATQKMFEEDISEFSDSSTDSDKTVPISPQQQFVPFRPFRDKHGYLVKSPGSQEI